MSNTYQLSNSGEKDSLIDSTYIFIGKNIWVEKWGKKFRMIFDFSNGTIYFVDDSKKIFAGGYVDDFFKEMGTFYEKFLKEVEKNYKLEMEDIKGVSKINLKLISDDNGFLKYEISSGDKKLFDVEIDRHIRLTNIFNEKNFKKYFLKFLSVSSTLEGKFYTKRKLQFENDLNKIFFKIYEEGFPTRIVEFRENREFYLTEIDKVVYQNLEGVSKIDNSYVKKSFSDFEEDIYGGE